MNLIIILAKSGYLPGKGQNKTFLSFLFSGILTPKYKNRPKLIVI